ncbi:FixH family protein [Paenibacillus sp. GYB004]|uniref:FixH family protein n=1 Tax=Paenibacillus sp. GYB004 TaxID=2994393 RepID=UPI002F967716
MKTGWAFALLLIFIGAVVWLRYVQDDSNGSSVYTDGRIRMELQAEPLVSRSMEETAFRLLVTEESGTPVIDADLQLFISMPNMYCGVFQGAITQSQPGVYIATAIPVMQGRWHAEAVLRRENGPIRVHSQFDVR